MISFKAKLDGLTRKMRALERLPRRLKAEASAKLATEATRLADESFGKRSDPYGKRWAKRVVAVPWPILEKSGATRASLRGEPLAAAFRLTFGTPYAKYHQSGTSRMKRRAMLPFRGLPRKWRRSLSKILDRELREAARA